MTGYLEIAALKIEPYNKQFSAVNPPALLPEITTFSLSTKFDLVKIEDREPDYVNHKLIY